MAVLLALLLNAGPARGADDSGNLLADPDFSAAQGAEAAPAAWFLYAPEEGVRAASRAEVLVDARRAHRGSSCMKVTSPGIRVHNSRDIPVQQGTEYEFTAFVRGKGSAKLGWYELQEARFLKTIEPETAQVLTDEWQPLRWRSRPTLPEANRVRPFVWCAGEVWVDTARLGESGSQAAADEPQLDPQAPPLLAPAYVSAPPTIDGRLAPGEWDAATLTTGFVCSTGELAPQQTRLWLAFDDERLYLALQSFSPNGVVGTVTRHDDTAMFAQDDTVEVFLRPGGSGPYYQFALNPLGTAYEACGMDSSWDAAWSAAAQVEKDAWLVGATWTAEVAIPFRALGLDAAPADGTLWTANVTRDWARLASAEKADNLARWTSWASVGGSYHAPERFGQWLFSRAAPALRLADLGDLAHGQVAIRGQVVSRTPERVAVAWRVSTAEQPTRTVAAGQQEVATAAGTATLQLDSVIDIAGGDAWPLCLDIQASSGGRACFRSHAAYRLLPAFRVDVLAAYTRGFLEARFDVSRLAGVPAGAVGRVELTEATRGVLAAAEVPDLGPRRSGNVRLDLKGIAPGEYVLQTRLVGPAGALIAASSRPCRIPPPPAWLGTTLGLSDRVPPPFEEVRVEGTAVSVWGRTYEFHEGLFPSQIVNQGVPQLARPAALVLERDGAPQTWARATLRVAEAKPTYAVLAVRAESPAAELAGTVRIEYDGWALFDFTLSPTGPVTVTGLRLELPLPRAEAAFLRGTGPICKWAEEKSFTALIGDVPNDTAFGPDDYAPGWTPSGFRRNADFAYLISIGADARALAVVQDSEENRFLQAGNLSLEPQGAVTVLNVLLIDRPVEVSTPLRYRLALVASPLKPYRHELERLAFAGGHSPQWVVDNGLKGWIPGALQWTWGRVEKDYISDDPTALASRAAAFAAAGMQCIPNQSNCFCVTPYEPFDTYRDEWVHEPYVAYPNHEGTRVSLVMCSPQSSFADFYLEWVKEQIERSGIGGLYFDLSGPAGNANPLSGGGWVDAQGVRHMTSTIFALRELYKRLYTLVKEEGARRGREMYIFQHGDLGPLTAFVDQVTVGEGYAAAKDWNCLTPNVFRAQSLRHYGAAFTFYPTVSVPWYRQGKYLAPHHEALALSLLHGTLTTALWTEQVLMDLFPLWRWRQEFGIEQATWVPWYAADARLQVTPATLRVSFHQRPGQVLATVVNLGQEPVEGSLRFDLAALGLPAGPLPAAEFHGLSAAEMRTPPGQPMRAADHPGPGRSTLRAGLLPITVRARNYSVIRVPAEE